MDGGTDGTDGNDVNDRTVTPIGQESRILEQTEPPRVGSKPPHLKRRIATEASVEDRAQNQEAQVEVENAWNEWLRAQAEEQEAREAQAVQDAGVEAPAADATEARRDKLPSYCMPLRVEPPRFDPGSEPSSDDEGNDDAAQAADVTKKKRAAARMAVDAKIAAWDTAVRSHAAGGAPGISPEKGASSAGASSAGASSAGREPTRRRTEVHKLSRFPPERKAHTKVGKLKDGRGKSPEPLKCEEEPSPSLKLGGAFKPHTPKKERK